ncbi:unnamed protein product [Acanthosepion pharaonis]|uniref:CULT domain-containing protein n=1 Tax=Acanthosepion pharaonis TaxID=158019 RepID=A0A812CR90_ACAPH|nr:unnamed protein product [Sepia pharaonis]
MVVNVVEAGHVTFSFPARSLFPTVSWRDCCFKFTYSLLVACTISNFVSALALSDGLEAFYLVCRQCGHGAALTNNLINVPSSMAYRQRNDTIQGQEETIIQLFRNPEGKYFEVITLSNADVLKVDKAHREESWFPGFSWSICVCPSCGIHLGWHFEATEVDTITGKRQSFFGLILNHLLHQLYADNLIMVPKSYGS